VIYNITTAQKHFEKLLARALARKEVILARRNDPVAELVPLNPRKHVPKKRRDKTN